MCEPSHGIARTIGRSISICLFINVLCRRELSLIFAVLAAGAALSQAPAARPLPLQPAISSFLVSPLLLFPIRRSAPIRLTRAFPIPNRVAARAAARARGEVAVFAEVHDQ